MYTNFDLLNLPPLENEQIKALGNDELAVYVKAGENKSFIEKIIFSFEAPWFWEFTIISFVYLFIPMLFGCSVLVYWEKRNQRKT